MLRGTIKVGQPVVFRKQKASDSPGPHAQAIRPCERGEDYRYFVDKLWAIGEIRDDGTLVLVTRTGKRHVIERDHPSLRRPTLLERLRYRMRFPSVDTPGDDGAA